MWVRVPLPAPIFRVSAGLEYSLTAGVVSPPKHGSTPLTLWGHRIVVIREICNLETGVRFPVAPPIYVRTNHRIYSRLCSFFLFLEEVQSIALRFNISIVVVESNPTRASHRWLFGV